MNFVINNLGYFKGKILYRDRKNKEFNRLTVLVVSFTTWLLTQRPEREDELGLMQK